MMSQTKWPLSNSARAGKLERLFAGIGVDASSPGIHDSPAFLAAERENPNILQDLAALVEVRTYSEEYLVQARAKIEVAAMALGNLVAADGSLGACVHASGTLGRLLDELGVWNYVAKATLTMTFPKNSGIGKRYFWAVDELRTTAPHAIVVAPPFGIIDLTIKHQPYTGNEATYLPDTVLASQFKVGSWHAEDLLDTALVHELQRRRILVPDFLKQECPSMWRAMQTISSPARMAQIGTVLLKYVITGVGGFTEKLRDIEGYAPHGMQPGRILDELIAPKLKLQGLG